MGIYTVKQINSYVKNMFSQDYLLSDVTVKGEVSNWKERGAGHIYFTLKDADAALSVVMFSGNRLRGLKCRLRDGLKIRVRGSISVYEAGGVYQLYAKTIEEEGDGELYREFLRLRQELQEMGMFDEAYKKPIPKYALTVGIVTSASGAALHDIMNIAARRNPHVKLVLAPSAVQGADAPQELVKAIEAMDRFRPDVMIVGRGGGSMEDLWCFNDPAVARAIFDCDTPVISAVGHEVDFTIADYVADLRAPTPSAAAELAVFDCSRFLHDLEEELDRMSGAVERRILLLGSEVREADYKLKLRHPQHVLHENEQRLTDMSEKLKLLMERKMQDIGHSLALGSAKLDSLSPLKKLRGGYGYIEGEDGPLLSAGDAVPGQILSLTLHDGTVKTEVL